MDTSLPTAMFVGKDDNDFIDRDICWTTYVSVLKNCRGISRELIQQQNDRTTRCESIIPKSKKNNWGKKVLKSLEKKKKKKEYQEKMYLETIANALSIITIASCFILKIPQIINLMKIKTAAGISILGLLLELTSYTVMTSYNYTNGYAILNYLEYPVILVQEFILIYLVLKYMNEINTRSLTIALLYFLLSAFLIFQIIPKIVLTFLAPMCTPISASSKIVQLLAILRAKNADSVSILTWFISAFTNLTRVFTIWVDSADILLLGNFIISVTLSSSIMFAAIYYKTRAKRE